MLVMPHSPADMVTHATGFNILNKWLELVFLDLSKTINRRCRVQGVPQCSTLTTRRTADSKAGGAGGGKSVGEEALRGQAKCPSHSP